VQTSLPSAVCDLIELKFIDKGISSHIDQWKFIDFMNRIFMLSLKAVRNENGMAKLFILCFLIREIL
jgi:hypothetical protein